MLIYLFIVVNSWLPLQPNNCPGLEIARSHFLMDLSENKLMSFLDKSAAYTCNNVQAYRASIYMRQAEFAFSPYKKWQVFKTGRDELEKTINESPEDVELRFIRYLTQSNIPGFLGYSKNIISDRDFILAKLPSSSISKEFQAIILKHLE